MSRRITARVRPVLLAAVAVLLVGCDGDEPSASDDSRDFVVLLDDESDPDQVQGKPGVFAVTARGVAEPPWAVIDVPGGYSNFGFFALWPHGSGDGSYTGPFRSLQYWTVYAVQEHPCRYQGSATEIGDSVDDLADALADQKMTTSTAPEQVSLAGHDGVYLELTMPSDIDFKRCGQDYFVLWEGSPGDRQHTAESPGMVERLWILDVDGDRVVLETTAAPGTSDVNIDELTAMVESVRFVEPD